MANISINSVLDAMYVFAPQFYTTDPDKLAVYYKLYDLLRCQVNAQFLSCCGVSVFAFLMAHYLQLAANANLGVISNLTEGDLSIGFNVSPDIDALMLTPYGRSYLDLVKRTTIGSTVTNLPVVVGGISQNMPLGCCNGWGYGFGNAGGGCC